MSDTKSAVEQRIVKLDRLVARTKAIALGLADLYVCNKPNRLKSLTAAMKTVDALRAEKVVGTRLVIDTCMNELTSLREGIFTGAALDKSDLQIQTCAAAVGKFQELMASARRRLDSMKRDNAEEQGIEVEADVDYSELAIIKNLKEKAKLPEIKGKAFVVGRAPVVIVTTPGGGSSSGVPGAKKVTFQQKDNPSNFVNRTVLEKGGFSVDNIDGYAIIHDQLVIGVNKSMIELDKRGRPAETIQEVAQRVMTSLSKASKKQMTLVTDGVYGYGGGSWFWIMPEKEMSLFSKAFPGGHPKLKVWGLAFANHSQTMVRRTKV